jgi:hypothetical protein
MLDEYIVCEQNRAAAQWRASCASDDALRRQIEARLSEGRLPSVPQARRCLEPEGAASRGRLIPFGRFPGRALSLG